MFKIVKRDNDGNSLRKIVLFNTFALGYFIETNYGFCLSLIFGIKNYEIHIQFRKWIINIKPIDNVQGKS